MLKENTNICKNSNRIKSNVKLFEFAVLFVYIIHFEFHSSVTHKSLDWVNKQGGKLCITIKATLRTLELLTICKSAAGQ